MSICKLLLLSFCCVLGSAIVRAESGHELENVINNFNRHYPQENVFVHIDNTGYYENEIVWFKAYLTRSDNDSLGSLSRILYVDLISPSGVVAETKKCRIENGMAHGEFFLAQHPGSGIYQIRAYTRYMLNWGNECVFTRAFPVFAKPSREGDYSKRKISMATADSTHVTVHFYPEGGCLVKNIESKVAFEITDGYGRAVNTKGWLKIGNQRVKEVITFMDGRGMFTYKPTEENAKLELLKPNGKMDTYALPEAQETGFMLSVDASGSQSIKWAVRHSATLNDMVTETLLVHHGKAKVVTSPLSRSDMPDGVSQLCLVDRNGAMLASRMVFNYPRKQIGNITVETKDTTIWPDKEVSFNIATKKEGAISISVCDAETELAAYKHNAATWLLLTSELKGYIRHPEYYFDKDDSIHRHAADLLMLIQGWRKYDVEAMDGFKDWKKTYPVERSQLIDGQLKPYGRRNNVAGANLSIKMHGPLGSLVKGNVTTDSTGYYVFTVPECWGKWDMIMHTTLKDKDARYYIAINRNFTPTVQDVSWYAVNDDGQIVPDLSFSLDAAHVDSIPMNLRSHWLPEVNVKVKRLWRTPKEFWERESVGARYASVKYDMLQATEEIADKGEAAPTIVEWLRNKNHLFDGTYDNVTGEEKKTNPSDGLHSDGPTYGNKGIMWIVDNRFVCGTGVPFTKMSDPTNPGENATEDYHVPFDIRGIRTVYISTANDDWYRFLHANDLKGRGIVTIFIYTKPEIKQQKGYRRSVYYGYSVPEDYATMVRLKGDDLAGADYRRTLYWNPDVSLDADGKAEITFKNNSTSRHMTISAMGFTTDGRPLVYRHK